MAPPGQEAEAEHGGQGGAQDEEDAQHEQLVGMMASLGLGLGEAESAAAAVARFRADEVAAEPARRFWKDAAAAAMRLWDEDAAAVDYFVPAAPVHRVVDPYAYAPPPPPPPPLLAAGAALGIVPAGIPRRGARRYEDHIRRGLVVGPRNERSGGVVHVGGHALMAPPPPPPLMHGGALPIVSRRMNGGLHPSEQEQAVLLALSQEHNEAIVSYACRLLESRHGHRLFRLVLGHCNQELREWVIANVTQDKKAFWRISTQRSDEVVFMIESCGTQRSKLLLREAMMSWMTPNQMYAMESNRLRVVEAFIKESPREITRFIFDAVARNCTRLACQPNGLNLLQKCLYFVNRKEKDDMFIQISYRSLQLSQNSSGNYIVQEVLKNGDPLHLATIASCLRTNYVELSRQKYSSNVVEQCLRVFDEGEKFVIVNELVCYPHFRDLVTDEFANFVISTALQTCNVQLQDILASTILDQNVNHRNQHCLKIFGLLSKLGYLQ